MRQQKQVQPRLWYRARLTPLAAGIFTEAFYPPPKRRTGAQHVFFTQVDLTPNTSKVLVTSRFTAAGLRIMTRNLAEKCLIPGVKATKAQMLTLNELSKNMKL